MFIARTRALAALTVALVLTASTIAVTASATKSEVGFLRLLGERIGITSRAPSGPANLKAFDGNDNFFASERR